MVNIQNGCKGKGNSSNINGLEHKAYAFFDIHQQQGTTSSKHRTICTQLLAQCQRTPFRHPVEQLPEAGTVVHLTGVCQLVQYHVIHQMRREQHQVIRQADMPFRRATSPPGACLGNLHRPIQQSVPLCPTCHQRRQILFRPFLQGTGYGIPHQRLYPFVPGQQIFTPSSAERTVKCFSRPGSSHNRKHSASSL